jgi:hypothetical protein
MPITRFKVKCPRCEARGTIRDEGLIGRTIGCPRCKNRFCVRQRGKVMKSAALSGGIADSRTRPAPDVSVGHCDQFDQRNKNKKRNGPVLAAASALGSAVLVAVGLVLWVVLSSPTQVKNNQNPVLAAAKLPQDIAVQPEDPPKDAPAESPAPEPTKRKLEMPEKEEPRPENPKREERKPAAPGRPIPQPKDATPPKAEQDNNQVVQVAPAIFVPQVQPLGTSVNLNVQPVISGDGSTVRVSLNTTFTLAVPGAPRYVATQVPVYPGPSRPGQGPQPINYIQVVQQPGFISGNVGTTVGVPIGGMAGVGGLNFTSSSFGRRR